MCRASKTPCGTKPFNAFWCLSIEGQHHARHLAGLHGAEGLVDVLQAATARDHLVEQEATLAVELEVAGDVGAEGV